MPPSISQYGTKPKSSCPGAGTTVAPGVAGPPIGPACSPETAPDVPGAPEPVGREPPAPRVRTARTTVTARTTAPTPMIGRRVIRLVGSGPWARCVNRLAVAARQAENATNAGGPSGNARRGGGSPSLQALRRPRLGGGCLVL